MRVPLVTWRQHRTTVTTNISELQSSSAIDKARCRINGKNSEMSFAFDPSFWMAGLKEIEKTKRGVDPPRQGSQARPTIAEVRT